MATYARYTRSAILDTLNKPFVTVLRAKGLSERKILFRHVIKNSAIPLVTVFLPTTPNPTSGFLLMFPVEDVIYLNMSFEEASKFIVSAGTSTKKS